MSKCTVYKKSCFEHGFYHGAEAEELRSGIERVIADLRERCADDIDSIEELRSIPDEIERDLLSLLDKVDARDSLAFLEARAQDEEDE